jgi:hypothetical protein
MRVLVAGSEPTGVQRATEQLRGAGHEVLRCHEDGEAEFPCAALRANRGCPLEVSAVDVVLDVHGTSPMPSPYEDGVACAVRQHIPLVVARVGDHPYTRWATREIDSDADVVAACEDAATACLVEHSVVAANAARSSLERAGLDSRGTTATVHRHDGRLQVHLRLPPHPEGLASMIGARVVGAVRAHDRSALGVDVTLV